MKNIQKGKEPPSLTQHRQAGGNFDDPGSWKQDTKTALLRDQGALCCYCMGRIDVEAMKVEHWRSQSGHGAQQLHYRNLLGACLGSEQNPTHGRRDIRHCDTRKGASPIELDPVAGVEHRIRYNFVDGSISGADPGAQRDIEEVLNLNAQNLQQSRRGVVDGVREGLTRKYPNRAWTRLALEREMERWSARDGNEYRPFCQVAVEFLRRQLGRVRA